MTSVSTTQNIKYLRNKICIKTKRFWRRFITINIKLDMSNEEIREKYAQQRENKDWTLYSERAFIEQLFSTRFNYFIASLSLFAAVVSRMESVTLSWILVLFCGTTILILMALAIYRIYVKLIIILKILYQLEDYHVFQMIYKETSKIERKNPLLVPANSIIGVGIPFFGCLIFLIYSIRSAIKLFC